ncbi:hypothetical protein SERLA73DRAFT_49488 [Serpula lacrymans var. lacrymans S7.3]|uniref:Uncharacterized protein n=1 Tax=Serpula lacrymans var. lacrymans (strain S7.3) TaxID=936435 RepID=F8PNW0_SERL3|nr:hypothetical protein SERLA73DRAFT_49488 [Serpula lacrymans var. lacrymans S7.3]
MPAPRALHLRLTHSQRRTVVSTLFSLTFFAAVLTVSASNVLPCPARAGIHRGRYADGGGDGDGAARRGGGRADVVVEKRPRRWIEETRSEI